MEYWWDKMVFPMQRVWSRLARHLGIRKTGLLKLKHDVRTCEYEDVHVLWELLRKSDKEFGRSPACRKKTPFSNIINSVLCRSF